MMIHRLRYAWHVLRGRPLAYRMEIYGRTLRIPDEPNVLVASPPVEQWNPSTTAKPADSPPAYGFFVHKRRREAPVMRSAPDQRH
jgi:hypothetical protein